MIDNALVGDLVAEHLPMAASLPITALAGGWDNRSYRLGERLVARLPSTDGYVASVEKEASVLPRLGHRATAAAAIWERALARPFAGPPVWLHGDLHPGNLLVRHDKLAAVIDWGLAAVGDPAADLSIAWRCFDGEARRAYRQALPADAAAWARGGMGGVEGGDHPRRPSRDRQPRAPVGGGDAGRARRRS